MAQRDVNESQEMHMAATKPLVRSKGREIRQTSAPGRRGESQRIFSRGLGGHEIFLEGKLRRRGPLRDKGQVEVVDDAVHHGIVGEESDESLSLAYNP